MSGVWFEAPRLRFRLWNHVRALLSGYFWLPCPLCQQMFGGHEWSKGGSGLATVPDPSGTSTTRAVCICPACQSIGRGHSPWFTQKPA